MAENARKFDEENSDSKKSLNRNHLKSVEEGDDQSLNQTGNITISSDSTYDDQGTDPSEPKPDLKKLEGGGESSQRKTGHLSEAGLDENRSEGRNSNEQGGANEASNSSFYAPKSKIMGQQEVPTKGVKGLGYKLFVTHRRKTATGGGIIGIILAVFFGLSVFQGPLQFIHLSQVLQKNFFGTERTTTIRAKGMYRFQRTGDIGETRVGKLGSVVYKRANGQLKDIGIEFERNQISGAPRALNIETAKNPDYKNLSKTEAKAAIIEDFKVTDVSKVKATPSGYVIEMDATSLKGIDFSKSLLKTSIAKLNSGKLQTAMNERIMTKYFNLPRLFSPLEKRVKATENNVAETIAAKQAEEERLKAIQEPEVAKATEARFSIKKALSDYKSGINFALVATAVMCLVRSIANDVVAVNHYAIVAPATLQAVDKIAVGEQVKSGQNFDTGQLNAIASSFTDPTTGENIWQGKALQATAGSSNPTGTDLPLDYGQAFSSTTTADNIRSIVDIKVFGVDLSGAACSTAGQIVQMAGALALLISGFFDFGASWGAYAASVSAQVAATSGVMYLLQQQLTNLLTDKAIVPEVLSGPLGGNLMAYGAREAANVGARASGGVELSDSQTANLDNEQIAQDHRDFQSKSIAYKLFNPYDQRTAIAGVIDNTSLSPSNNLAKMGSMFLNFRHSFAAIPSLFTPHAHAATEPYNWGFPRYGIPDSVSEDPNYVDPYTNADSVAALLDRQDLLADALIKKASTCFGAIITKDSGVWDVVPDHEVIPTDPDYIEADCNASDDTWRRVMLFVFDTRLMIATACYTGVDASACSDIEGGGAAAVSGN